MQQYVQTCNIVYSGTADLGAPLGGQQDVDMGVEQIGI
jgi:hypothetical protein